MARCGIRRPLRRWPPTHRTPTHRTHRKEHADGRRRTAHHHRARGVRRLRGGLEGLEHTAHPADVGRERDPRHHPRRRDHRRRPSSRRLDARARPRRRRARDRQPRRRLRCHRPHARDVPRPSFDGLRDQTLAELVEASTRHRCTRLHRPEGVRSMTILSPTWTAILYLVAAVCFILALKGLSSPKTARRGNLIGAAGALVAVITVFLSTKLDNIPWILAAIAVGAAIAAPVARRVQMTQMPQLVALFNGVGGGAAALVALLELPHTDDPWVRLAIVFTLLVGAISFSGSLVTFAKLQELMTTRPVVFAGLPVLMGLALLAAIVASGFIIATGAGWLAVVLLVLGLVTGVLLVLPVGGADVPIVISLLNAFTG